MNSFLNKVVPTFGSPPIYYNPIWNKIRLPIDIMEDLFEPAILGDSDLQYELEWRVRVENGDWDE